MMNKTFNILLLAFCFISCNAFELLGDESFNELSENDRVEIFNVNLSAITISGSSQCDPTGTMSLEGKNFQEVRSLVFRSSAAGTGDISSQFTFSTVSMSEIQVSFIGALMLAPGDYDLEIEFMGGERFVYKAFNISTAGAVCTISNI